MSSTSPQFVHHSRTPTSIIKLYRPVRASTLFLLSSVLSSLLLSNSLLSGSTSFPVTLAWSRCQWTSSQGSLTDFARTCRHFSDLSHCVIGSSPPTWDIAGKLIGCSIVTEKSRRIANIYAALWIGLLLSSQRMTLFTVFVVRTAKWKLT